jgi:hypothetical protein
MARTPISQFEDCTSYTDVYNKFVVSHLPDREIACDYHKGEHKRRADDASAGDRKSLTTTCLTAFFHICLPLR